MDKLAAGRGDMLSPECVPALPCLFNTLIIQCPCSVIEFRQMVMALHQAGWRVVLDVVYNHTFRAGPHDRCVLCAGL